MDTDQEQPTRVPKWDKVVFETLRAIDEIKDRTLGQLKRNFVYDLLGDEAIEYIRCHPWPVRLERGLVPSERSLFLF